MPAGSFGSISVSRARTPDTTSRALAPRSPSTTPCTVSPVPSAVTLPYRVALAICTRATSPMRTGWPRAPSITVSRRSASPRTLPSTRTTRASSPSLIRPAPSFRLFVSMASRSCASVIPRAFIRSGIGATS